LIQIEKLPKKTTLTPCTCIKTKKSKKILSNIWPTIPTLMTHVAKIEKP
jgi:hypothetical protein